MTDSKKDVLIYLMSSLVRWTMNKMKKEMNDYNNILHVISIMRPLSVVTCATPRFWTLQSPTLTLEVENIKRRATRFKLSY